MRWIESAFFLTSRAGLRFSFFFFFVVTWFTAQVDSNSNNNNNDDDDDDYDDHSLRCERHWDRDSRYLALSASGVGYMPEACLPPKYHQHITTTSIIHPDSFNPSYLSTSPILPCRNGSSAVQAGQRNWGSHVSHQWPGERRLWAGVGPARMRFFAPAYASIILLTPRRRHRQQLLHTRNRAARLRLASY